MKKYTHLYKSKKFYILLLLLLISLSAFLYAEGPHIRRLTGVNWFGFETGDYAAHGLWTRDYRSMLRQIKDLGFNCVRIPWSNEMLNHYPANIISNVWVSDPYTGQMGINMNLAGRSSLEVLDKIIEEAERLGLRIILDCHSRAANGYLKETLWYTDEWPESRWISDWVFIAQHYLHKRAVIAFDLNNEPHGGLHELEMKPPASWGYDVPGYGITDWKAAAERCAAAIHEVHPEIIIIIQGVQESSDGSNYWWGSNHKDLRIYPVTTIPGSRLMFSVHEYGPSVTPQLWFDDPSFPNNLEDLWRDRFWFIYEQNIAGLYIGEMGLKEEEASDPSCIAYQWFTRWLEFAGHKVHWTYWCWNPNSGDTGGILQDDWVSVNPVKYNLIQPYLEPINGVTRYPTPPHQPTPYPTPTPPYTPEPTNPTGGVFIDAHFSTLAEGFSYVDDPFRDTNNPKYASGAYDSYGGISGGGLRVYLGGVNSNGEISGGWSEDFYSSGEITISMDYRMVMGPGYDTEEYADAIVSLNGSLYLLTSVTGDGNNGGNMDTGWRNESITVNPGSGNHTIIIGVYNNNATTTDAWVDFFIDNVWVGEAGVFPTVPPGNLGDVNSDGYIDIVDSLVISQYYVGLNPQNFNPDAADVDCNSIVDMIDALIISKFHVGHIVSFC